MLYFDLQLWSLRDKLRIALAAVRRFEEAINAH
jgi:hypothetical protein